MPSCTGEAVERKKANATPALVSDLQPTVFFAFSRYMYRPTVRVELLRTLSFRQHPVECVHLLYIAGGAFTSLSWPSTRPV